jgi:predicted glycogen debranching enzyme
VFRTTLNAGDSTTLASTAENHVPDLAMPALARERTRQEQLLSGVGKNAPQWIRQLTLAADQFIVSRQSGDERTAGTTIIAGYPWFSDWGRDTMIALPGLALATGRLEDAAAILRTFADHVSDGMLPNRFPDGNEAPDYNTVDATLWYFHAIDTYIEATGDKSLLAELYPVLQDIIRWHIAGTRYGIGVDERDGLLRAGEKGVQLTWMDAKVGDWVVTPRIGKPVEINALWHYALARMSAWAKLQRDKANSRIYAAAAGRAAESFASAFWYTEGGFLFDVVDGPDGEWQTNGRRADKSIRPNQVFAVSLGGDLLDAKQQRAVVDICSRHLLTPMGLRSLSPEDPAYVPHYEGGPWQRDGAYHQGTVWSWLLGPYAIAHQRVFGDADKALAILEQIAPHLADACVGSISEIFDAAPPHAPRGCFAQAWSVAELLRAWHALDAQRAEQHTRNIRHG